MSNRFSKRFTSAVLIGMLALAMSLWPAAAQDEGVVARIGDKEITEAELATAAAMYGDELASMPEDAKRSIMVDALIDIELARVAGKASGLDQTEEFRRQAAFLEGQALRAVFMEAEIAKRVDEAAIRKAYEAHIEAAQPVEEFRARQILLGTEADAIAVIERLKAGEDFATIAKEGSLDEASKQNGGDLGFMTRGTSLPEIEDAIADLSPGQFADKPIQTAFGYHVVKLEDVRNQPSPTFEALAPRLRQMLEAQAAQQIIVDLRSSTKIEKLVPDVQPPQADDGHDH